jgi:hypothetical protein
MSYYHLGENVERPPKPRELKPDGVTILGKPEGGWTPELLAYLRFVTIVETVQPADTPTHTTTPGVSRVGDVVTRTWTPRAFTQAELTARAAEDARLAKAGNLNAAAVTWLRNRATAADAVTVTSGNAVAVVQSLCDDLAIFFARFADFVEVQVLGK